MNDQTAQDPQKTNSSYVDDYLPPTDDSNLTDVPLDGGDSNLGANNSTPTNMNIDSASEDVLVVPKDGAKSDVTGDEKVESTLEGDNASGNSSGDDFSKEDIETQNIFFMLGVEKGDDNLKEKFLDQLQDVIWDDFLTNDVSLLLTQEEMTKFNDIKKKADSANGADLEKARDEMVEYLEGIIPDLEDIMLEKALDLKADLFVERINGMKEYFAEKPDQLAEVNKAEQFMFEDKWMSAAQALNSIKE